LHDIVFPSTTHGNSDEPGNMTGGDCAGVGCRHVLRLSYPIQTGDDDEQQQAAATPAESRRNGLTPSAAVGARPVCRPTGPRGPAAAVSARAAEIGIPFLVRELA
jgi:hypothetical protein